ncbi:MAG: beta-(1-6) glucans synthase [Xanthobacteraceae bacterium]|uniref:glycoside hydrolase family 17 protein n=1 Tax=Pseudolabrys sp. TaxID=1960880 RepID=UPI003D0BB694
MADIPARKTDREPGGGELGERPGLPLALFAATALAIAGFWAWLGAAVPMPQAAGAGEKLYCVSYAPFRGGQSPLVAGTMISAAQIDEDLAHLATMTNCVRVYSVDFGLDQIAGLAQKHGLKVIQGLWLSSKRDKNREQIEGAVTLANRYPQTIIAVVVGNEVLLRGELSADDVAAAMREVKSRVSVPITYADVWEFWLRNRRLADIADFVTIHILPYWEDEPIAAEHAAAHVDSIRARVAKEFPGKEILIGEVGWPSAGRMREGALPSPSNQARVVQEVLAAAKRGNYHANIIEAFDQPWKRALEGTVGGHWGLFFDAGRTAKFKLGMPVSDHPFWIVQAGGGVLFAMLVFGAALFGGRRNGDMAQWLGVAFCAAAGGALIGWTIENLPLESLGTGGWLRSLVLAATALTAAPLCAVMLMRQTPLPRLSSVLAKPRAEDTLTRGAGALMTVTLAVAIVVALGLAFDPRYKDFPFAPLTGAIVPLLAVSLLVPGEGRRGVAELTGGALLAASAAYIVANEGFANWQSLWFCAALAALAVILVRVRGARD